MRFAFQLLTITPLLLSLGCATRSSTGDSDEDPGKERNDAGSLETPDAEAFQQEDSGPSAEEDAGPAEVEDAGPPQPTVFALPDDEWSHGDPSDYEQELLERVQRARANPQAEGHIIVALPEAQSAIEYFGVNTSRVVSEFQTYRPVPPLAFDPQLMEAARFHSLDMARNGFQEHDGSAGESFSDRIDASGYRWRSVAENIYAYAETMDECNAAFLIDWGNETIGHREAILDLESRKVHIGISVIENPSSPNVGPFVVTQDFGTPRDDSNLFLTGVVYEDRNGSGIYDAGEGIAGRYVVPENGSYYAVTSSSGGYAIPIAIRSSRIRVQLQTADGELLDETEEMPLDGENLKVDFVF